MAVWLTSGTEMSTHISNLYLRDVTTTAGADVVWQAWVANAGTSATTIVGSNLVEYARPDPQAIQAAERKALARREQFQKAVERAHALLQSILTPQQWEMLMEKKYFYERGKAHAWYRISNHASQNIQAINGEGVIREGLCIMPATGDYPIDDILAMQVLKIRYDEPDFLRTARSFPGKRGERVSDLPLPVAR